MPNAPLPSRNLPGNNGRPLPPQPHFGWLHLLVWLACFGFVLLCQTAPNNVTFARPWQNLGLIFQLVAQGAGLASLILFCWRKFRRGGLFVGEQAQGAPFPVQPGHWLLLIFGSQALHSNLLLLFTAPSKPSSTTIWLVQGIAAGVQLLLAWGMVRHSQPWGVAWQRFSMFYVVGGMVWLVYQWIGSDAFFLMTGGAYSSPTLNICFAVLHALGRYGLPTAWFIAAVLGILDDFRQPHFRDWLHWLGVGLLAFLAMQ